MITDISISNICEAGNHALITYTSGAEKSITAEYAEFFANDFAGNAELLDLQYLLNQFEHTSWLTLKAAMEA